MAFNNINNNSGNITDMAIRGHDLDPISKLKTAFNEEENETAISVHIGAYVGMGLIGIFLIVGYRCTKTILL